MLIRLYKFGIILTMAATVQAMDTKYPSFKDYQRRMARLSNSAELFKAASIGDARAVAVLVKNADVDFNCTENRETPLTIAAQWGYADVVEELLKEGANPNQGNVYGATPLMMASMEGHMAVVKLLMAKKPYVNAVDDRKWTALMWASYNGHAHIMEELKKGGADDSMVAERGYTASSLFQLSLK